MVKFLGYLGPSGTFSEEASMMCCADLPFVLKEYPTIDKVIEAVEREEVALGLVPVENSLEGSVNLTLDILSGITGVTKVQIRGEIIHKIRHYLMARPGQQLSNITEIYSHQQAFAQCRLFLDKTLPGTARINMSSTVEAAKLVRNNNNKAVIGSLRASQLYGLDVLQGEIEDDQEGNYTRFLLLGLDDAPLTGNDKTSLVIGLRHQAGSLHAALGVFTQFGINLTKIESRPIRGNFGQYIFFLDIEGHRKETNVSGALQELNKTALFVKILGSYPALLMSASIAP